MSDTIINSKFVRNLPLQYFPAHTFPTINPIFWLHSHFAVGGGSPLQRLSGMYTAHMTRIAPQNGFTVTRQHALSSRFAQCVLACQHPHRGLEIYTWVLEGTLFHQDSTGGEGEIQPGEIQRMFSGDLILHQELNRTDDPVRVIQIWFAADRKYKRLPHYQQLRKNELPARREGDATVSSLIGDDSPMEQHTVGAPRLTATVVPAGGKVELAPPRRDEDLFLYVTEGAGGLETRDWESSINQYDVVLARADVKDAALHASADQPLSFLNFYLPKFIE